MKRFQRLISLLLVISWTLILSSCSLLGHASLKETLGDELYDELVTAVDEIGAEVSNEITGSSNESTGGVETEPSKVDFSAGITIVDELDGVAAYYRPNTNDNTDDFYSCAAYVKRYYISVYSVDVWNLKSNCSPLASTGSFSIAESPQKGDIGSINNGRHWFIIKQVNDDGSCVIIEQNWKMSNSTDAKINRVLQKGDYVAYHWSKEST